ncbi:MAG: tandem-95 repeat protein [Calditrichae bacterium]|nr:tandem-95 repeat protein [Calditrichia bacterium]
MPVTDPDKDDVGKLNFTATNLPEGATLSSSTGEFFWTPTYEQSGNYQVNFQVTDSFGATDNTQVSITVENVNRPPSIEGLGKKSVQENELLEFTLVGNDPDKEDEGKVSLRPITLPRGASFNANSGQFTWTPDFNQSGDYVIEFEATDGQAASVTETILVDVENVNRTPEIDSPGNQSVREGETLSFRVTATDPDKEDAGNLQFSSDNLPKGAQFKPNGEFSWTPGVDQQGSYDITLTVTDSGDMSDSITISVQVEDVGGSPEGQ